MNESIDISFDARDGYLLVTAGGQWTIDNVKLLIDDVARNARELGHARVLLDARRLSAPAGSFNRFLAGVHVAETWGYPLNLRVAAVSRKEHINKFAENTAVNRGATINVVPDIDEALDWLIKNPIKMDYRTRKSQLSDNHSRISGPISMNNLNRNRMLRSVLILFISVISGCASLPCQKTGIFNHRQVEFSLIRNASGSAVVVFENGLNGRMLCWNDVIAEVSKDATTLAYNRPGCGNSDAVPSPRDGLHIVDELRAFLGENGLKPPYVLVGHSIGGLYMQLFARRYPDDVAGLILVDSTHPRQFRGKGALENWPAWIRALFRLYLPAAAEEEFDLANETGDAVLAAPPFTGKPVIVLSALGPMRQKSELADDANEKRKDVARLYPGSKQVWVDSGHNIPQEKPEPVIAAVREVLNTAGTQGETSGGNR